VGFLEHDKEKLTRFSAKIRPQQQGSAEASHSGGLREDEVELVRQFDQCFAVITVLEQGVLHCCRVADEQTPKEAVLFAGNPVTPSVSADKDDSGCGRATRGRFDELHVDKSFQQTEWGWLTPHDRGRKYPPKRI
jgi:hypothetical protein